MIQSKLGEVKLTAPNYNQCDVLGCSKQDVDDSVEAILYGDLVVILMALARRYGTEHAMQMWTLSAEAFIKNTKGEL